MTQAIRQSGNVESVLNALRLHWSEEAPRDMRKAFDADPQRFAQLSAQLKGFLLDWSKCNVSRRTMQLLQLLAKAADIAGKRDAMFAGAPINSTENRAVLHIALRNCANRPILVDGKDVMPAVNDVLKRMAAFATGPRGHDQVGRRRQVHRYRQYRHRRFRSRAGAGDAGAGALS
jgi:glucose-6-phosphate isomerase